MMCPSLTELCARNANEVFADHIAECARCRALLERLERSEPDLGELGMPPTGGDREPRAREIWTIWAPRIEEYLVAAVLERDEEEALVLPLLSLETWGAEADVELEQEVLGYPALAPLWAVDHILIEQAVEAVDILSEEWIAQLVADVTAFESGEQIASRTGPEILGPDDPRIDAQVALAEWIRPWFDPRGALQRGDELGPVLAERREELGVTSEELSKEIDVETKTWSAFEAAKADPFETVPARAMALAVQGLGLLPSRRVVSLARESVENHNKGIATGGPRAMARRMEGSTAQSGRDKEAVAKAADDYAEALAKALGI
ncbi:MAG: hypothetical protein QOI84_821 [Solirubrobacterales bacterium]|jgi:DNA-binding XRE family transcriptional regulator|nr:hypothetical protein [Solirubrobacterales bacterium]